MPCVHPEATTLAANRKHSYMARLGDASVVNTTTHFWIAGALVELCTIVSFFSRAPEIWAESPYVLLTYI